MNFVLGCDTNVKSVEITKNNLLNTQFLLLPLQLKYIYESHHGTLNMTFYRDILKKRISNIYGQIKRSIRFK